MKNKEKLSPEKLLIETYKHIDEARNHIDQLVNQFGAQQLSRKNSPLPEDVEKIIQILLNFPPEKRKWVLLFLESIRKNLS